MSVNPYQSSITGTRPLPEPTTRAGWIAALLALFMTPTIAMLYVARPWRALVYLGAAIAGLLLMVYGGSAVLDPLVFVVVFEISLRVVGAIDALRLARAWHGGDLPWYARMPGVVGAFVALQIALQAFRLLGVESFRIVSSSMAPTLDAGDMVFVDKTAYGWNVPMSNRRFLRFDAPQRGDVAVFLLPEPDPDAGTPYVMRVVGLPGERIEYTNDRVSVDGVEQTLVEQGTATIRDGAGTQTTLPQYEETLGGVRHAIVLDPERPAYRRGAGCDDTPEGGCIVPAGHYFVMGDNRRNSRDSRYIGAIPDERFVGRVTEVWYSKRDAGAAGRE